MKMFKFLIVAILCIVYAYDTVHTLYMNIGKLHV